MGRLYYTQEPLTYSSLFFTFFFFGPFSAPQVIQFTPGLLASLVDGFRRTSWHGYNHFAALDAGAFPHVRTEIQYREFFTRRRHAPHLGRRASTFHGFVFMRRNPHNARVQPMPIAWALVFGCAGRACHS